jgi:hypothetical protein
VSTGFPVFSGQRNGFYTSSFMRDGSHLSRCYLRGDHSAGGRACSRNAPNEFGRSSHCCAAAHPSAMKARLAAKLFNSGPCDLSGIAATSADLDDLTGDDLADRVVAVNQVERPQGQSTDGLVLGNCSAEVRRTGPCRYVDCSRMLSTQGFDLKRLLQCRTIAILIRQGGIVVTSRKDERLGRCAGLRSRATSEVLPCQTVVSLALQ